jgi:hypothetical protein
MQTQRNRRVSGHVYRKQQKKGPTWYWKVRLPDGGEERKAIGPEWTGTDRPPDGYFTKRTAQVALEARLTDLRRSVGISTRTGATFDGRRRTLVHARQDGEELEALDPARLPLGNSYADMPSGTWIALLHRRNGLSHAVLAKGSTLLHDPVMANGGGPMWPDDLAYAHDRDLPLGWRVVNA